MNNHQDKDLLIGAFITIAFLFMILASCNSNQHACGYDRYGTTYCD